MASGVNALESSLGAALRRVPHLFYHKFHDGMYNARPGDFLVADKNFWNIIECKLLTTAGNLPASRLTPVQRNFCSVTEDAGGRYWLIVQFYPKKLVAYRGSELLDALHGGTRSLTGREPWGIPVPHLSGYWAVEGFLAP